MQLEQAEGTQTASLVQGEQRSKPVLGQAVSGSGERLKARHPGGPEGDPSSASRTAAESSDRVSPPVDAPRPILALKPSAEIGPDNHRFQLIRELGSEELCRVWLGRDLSPGEQTDEQRLRTLKIFIWQDSGHPQDTLAKDEAKASWLDASSLRAYLVKLRVRVELAAQLNHPNIARIYGLRQDNKEGWVFLEMEYADQRAGSTLDRLLRSEARPALSLERTLMLLTPVAEALDYAHREHRLAHRAVRAENLFVTALGTVNSRDPAGLEASAAADGKLESQQAEQLRSKQDISALAILTYRMLTAKPPFEDSASPLGEQALYPPKPAELSETSWKILRECLDYRSQRCLTSAVELMRQLGSLKRDSQGFTPGLRGKALLWPAALVALGFLSGSALGWYFSKQLYQQPAGPNLLATSAATAAQTVTSPGNTGATPPARRNGAEGAGAEKIPGQGSEGAAGSPSMAPSAALPQEEAQIKREMDDSAFAAAQRIDTVTAYRIYLQRCPDCAHQADAQAALKDAEKRAKTASLKTEFESRLAARELIGEKNSATAVVAELEALNPKDSFLVEAKKRLALATLELARGSLNRGDFAAARDWLAKGKALQPGWEALASLATQIDKAEQKARDEAAYAEAEQRNTQKAYQAYLAACAPVCGHRQQAAAAIEQLKSMPPSAANTVFPDMLTDGSPGPEMVVIQAGGFMMGSPPEEPGRFRDEHQHRVEIQRDFAISRYEVTFEDYDRFAAVTGRGKPDDKGWGRGTRPVINVDWSDATAYAEWLSAQTRQRYRLPTEAEWEYAARAGSQTAWFWGNSSKEGCAYANGADATGKLVFAGWDALNCQDGYVYTAPVGSFKSNAFGLYDMIGNVLEWTCSAYDEGYSGGEQRCEGKGPSLDRVYRGGSWSDEPRSLRSADRHKDAPEFRDYFLGFRLVREL
jgi:formylglycine-generating enzyme required for sulfatase activity